MQTWPWLYCLNHIAFIPGFFISYNLFDLVLKSPQVTSKNGPFWAAVAKSNSKLSRLAWWPINRWKVADVSMLMFQAKHMPSWRNEIPR